MRPEPLSATADPLIDRRDEADSYPDVWWGEQGIDALIWADPIPYVPPELRPDAEMQS